MQLSNTIPEKCTSMGQFLYTNCNTFSEKVIERQYARQPELAAKYGEKGKNCHCRIVDITYSIWEKLSVFIVNLYSWITCKMRKKDTFKLTLMP